jgi:hypothetical protein
MELGGVGCPVVTLGGYLRHARHATRARCFDLLVGCNAATSASTGGGERLVAVQAISVFQLSCVAEATRQRSEVFYRLEIRRPTAQDFIRDHWPGRITDDDTDKM